MKRVLLLLLFSVAVASYAAADYGLEVAGVRVTSDNKDNITGTGISGSVSYNYSTNTLTLNDATIDVRNMPVNAITNDYGSRANFKIKLVGNNLIRINTNSIAINVKESQGFELYSSGNGTGTLTCDGALYLDARDHMTNDCTMSTIWNCTVYFGDIMSEDYEECLTINNANVTTEYLNVGSDHNGQKGLNLIDCYLAYPTNGVVDQFGSIHVDGDFWHGHVEIKRGGRHGDVNGDGHVNSADVTALYDYMLNNETSNLKYGDVDGDGHINSADITGVYDVLLGNYVPISVVEYYVNGVIFRMVDVQGGTFMMGATTEQVSEAYSNEIPVHQVTLSSFSIGQTEVTQELWLAVMGSNPSYFSSNSGFATNLQRPVDMVNWDDCQTFITKLNQMTGKNFRLPTEAEWEYAARGGNQSNGYKYAGSNTIGEVAWYEMNAYYVGSGSPNYGTNTVATKQPNELGIYDMSGNVWEWCQDWYDDDYYSVSPSTNPTGPASGSYRVTRGGDWAGAAGGCRVSRRVRRSPDFKDSGMGLRLAM